MMSSGCLLQVIYERESGCNDNADSPVFKLGADEDLENEMALILELGEAQVNVQRRNRA